MEQDRDVRKALEHCRKIASDLRTLARDGKRCFHRWVPDDGGIGAKYGGNGTGDRNPCRGETEDRELIERNAANSDLRRMQFRAENLEGPVRLDRGEAEAALACHSRAVEIGESLLLAKTDLLFRGELAD